MPGRSSPITSPSRKSSNEEKDDNGLYEYSPLSSVANSPQRSSPHRSPLQAHRDEGFYASPTSSTRSDYRFNSNNNTSPPPPAYTSPTRTVSSAQSGHSGESRYSSLMQYLDTDTTTSAQRPNQHHHPKSQLKTERSDKATVETVSTQNRSTNDSSNVAAGSDIYQYNAHTYANDYDYNDDNEKLGLSTYGEDSTYAGDNIHHHDDHHDDDAITAVSSMSLSPHKPHKHTQHQGYTGKATSASASAAAGNTSRRMASNHSHGNSTGGKSGATYVWDEWDGSGGPSSGGQTSHSDTGTGGGTYLDKYSYGSSAYRADADADADGVYDENTNYGDATEKVTYFSSTVTDVGVGSSSSSTIGGASSVQTIITHVKDKVDTLSKQLQQRKLRAQELQNELIRVHTARKRRLQKFKKEWELRLDSQREQQKAGVKRVSEFLTRVQTDVKSLQQKISSLYEKQSKMDNEKDTMLSIAMEEASRKARQQRKQWEIEENIVFEKAFTQKIEIMKKDAADSYGPELDRYVTEGKLKLRARQEECNLRVQKLRSDLSIEVDNKVAKAIEILREQLRNDEDIARKNSERKLAQTLDQHNEEIKYLKEKYQREKKILEDNTERQRRGNAEQTLESMREIRNSETKQLNELMISQQRELGQLAIAHSECLKKLNTEQQQRSEEFEKRLNMTLRQETIEKKEKMKHDIYSKNNHDIERVLAKLNEEVTEERQKIKKDILGEIDQLRLSTHDHLEAMQASERRSIARSVSLKGEIDDLNAQINQYNQIITQRMCDLTSVKKELSRLRVELREQEQLTDAADTKVEDERQKQRREFSSHLSCLEQEEVVAKETLHRTEIACANHLDDMRNQYTQDLVRIKEKVTSLLQSKDNVARDLRKQLSILQDASEKSQNKLDKLRAEQYAGLGDSTDTSGDGEFSWKALASQVATSNNNGHGHEDDYENDSDEEEGQHLNLLQKLNIGNVDINEGKRSTTTTNAGGAGVRSRHSGGGEREGRGTGSKNVNSSTSARSRHNNNTAARITVSTHKN